MILTLWSWNCLQTPDLMLASKSDQVHFDNLGTFSQHFSWYLTMSMRYAFPRLSLFEWSAIYFSGLGLGIILSHQIQVKALGLANNYFSTGVFGCFTNCLKIFCRFACPTPIMMKIIQHVAPPCINGFHSFVCQQLDVLQSFCQVTVQH